MGRLWPWLRGAEAGVAGRRAESSRSTSASTLAHVVPISPGAALQAYVDASTRSSRVTGLGVVIRDAQQQLIGWHARTARGMTNNEGEYEALIFALEVLMPVAPATLTVYSDSRIMIDQMNGAARVHSPGLRVQHRRATALLKRLPRVVLAYVPREWNVLADAMAEDAVLRGT